MSKHTPGPWEAIGAVVYFGRLGGISLHGAPNPVANANLIAAAPDLLEALEALFAIGDVFSSAIEHKEPHCQSFDAWAESALKAIARAKGERK